MLNVLRILFAVLTLLLGLTGLLTDTIPILPYLFLSMACMLLIMALTEFQTKRNNRVAILLALTSILCIYNSLSAFLR